MKKLILLSLMLLLGTAVSQAQNSAREERRAARAAQRSAEYEAAVQALNDQQFILEANRLQTRRGTMIQVSSSQNYVLVDGDLGIVQFTVQNTGLGSNGIGGATLAGTVSNVSMKTNRRGNITYRFFIQSSSISGSVTISMPSGSNSATARVSSTIQGSRFTLLGNIIPGSRSDVFKGRPFQNIPGGIINRPQFF